MMAQMHRRTCFQTNRAILTVYFEMIKFVQLVVLYNNFFVSWKMVPSIR